MPMKKPRNLAQSSPKTPNLSAIIITVGMTVDSPFPASIQNPKENWSEY
eukprot:CAMPEP_0182494308 /NCGR_PEP_ID=MMETSP1321-20130603/3193_1 /TAXON_ID=91990 /ORGANISM="Bolidomonas sp., Strain RCC1657" /LENGTH=48 /DNA_ID= /DNA_START= /DNA_END= /DNA_ORIENTATION=